MAAENRLTKTVAANAEIFQWLLDNPDEFASAVADAYSNWSPQADGVEGDFVLMFQQEVTFQRLRKGLGGFDGRSA